MSASLNPRDFHQASGNVISMFPYGPASPAAVSSAFKIERGIRSRSSYLWVVGARAARAQSPSLASASGDGRSPPTGHEARRLNQAGSFAGHILSRAFPAAVSQPPTASGLDTNSTRGSSHLWILIPTSSFLSNISKYIRISLRILSRIISCSRLISSCRVPGLPWKILGD